MDVESDKITLINNLIKGCLLPELIKDVGENYLSDEHFDDFRKNLNINLIQLFDLIQLNETLIIYNEEKEVQELRYELLLLLCEQSAPNTLYQTHNHDLLKNINCLIDKHFMKILNRDQGIFTKILNYYKNRLNAVLWKKNLGAVHGFVQFCDIYYEKNTQKLDTDAVTFLLSVGLLFRDFYEPSYKELGYKLLCIILEQTPKELIKEMNIQNVIYDSVFQDLVKIDSEKSINYILRCLLICLSFFNVTTFHKWNNIDDLINELIRRITFAPNIKFCSILFLFISKIILKFSKNSTNIEDYMYLDIEQFNSNIDEIKEKCSKLETYASYRWIKKFLQIIVAESNYLMANSKDSHNLLRVLLIFYLICIYPVPINIIDIHLKEFFHKFSVILMEILRLNQDNKNIVMIIKIWFEIFIHQMSDYKLKDTNFCEYSEAFEKILLLDVFTNIQ